MQFDKNNTPLSIGDIVMHIPSGEHYSYRGYDADLGMDIIGNYFDGDFMVDYSEIVKVETMPI